MYLFILRPKYIELINSLPGPHESANQEMFWDFATNNRDDKISKVTAVIKIKQYSTNVKSSVRCVPTVSISEGFYLGWRCGRGGTFPGTPSREE